MVLSSLAFYLSADETKFGYTGSEKCGMCHKKDADGNQLKIWKESDHAKAYETLKSEDADKLAGGKAVENENCLSCHATGYGSDASLNDAKFSHTEGVGCEACHGAGQGYKSLKVMKSREESVKNGLVVWENDEGISNMCLTCHAMDKKPEGHPHNEFDFAVQYPKVAHPNPNTAK